MSTHQPVLPHRRVHRRHILFSVLGILRKNICEVGLEQRARVHHDEPHLLYRMRWFPSSRRALLDFTSTFCC